eukprot:COSAG02_NODE_30918_length_542_cov_1.747178_1_plen_58_part_10
MRVRLRFEAALVAEELRCCMFAVPTGLKTVADLVRRRSRRAARVYQLLLLIMIGVRFG